MRIQLGIGLTVCLAVGCFNPSDVDEDTEGMDGSGTADTGSDASQSGTSNGSNSGSATSTTGETSTSTTDDMTTAGPDTGEPTTTSGTTGDETTTGSMPLCGDEGEVFVDLANPPDPLMCNTMWNVSGVDLEIRENEHPTCGTGSCSAGSDAQGVWLYPAQLHADLGALGCEVTRVEADVTSYASSGVILYLYDENGEIVAEDVTATTNMVETIGVDVPKGVTVVAASLNHCEGLMHRIYVF